jgi:hypothetical protein
MAHGPRVSHASRICFEPQIDNASHKAHGSRSSFASRARYGPHKAYAKYDNLIYVENVFVFICGFRILRRSGAPLIRVFCFFSVFSVVFSGVVIVFLFVLFYVFCRFFVAGIPLLYVFLLCLVFLYVLLKCF